MIRVVVTGSECTGKTTLAKALAAHYKVDWVPEFARQFVDEIERSPDASDVESIARGQMDLEDQASDLDQAIFIQDTDLLSTVVYAHHYYGGSPDWIEAALLDRAADLYLLAGIDVPWAEDGQMRDRGDRREEMQGLFRQALISRQLPFEEIEGRIEARVERAVSEIARRLSSR